MFQASNQDPLPTVFFPSSQQGHRDTGGNQHSWRIVNPTHLWGTPSELSKQSSPHAGGLSISTTTWGPTAREPTARLPAHPSGPLSAPGEQTRRQKAGGLFPIGTFTPLHGEHLYSPFWLFSDFIPFSACKSLRAGSCHQKSSTSFSEATALPSTQSNQGPSPGF